MSSTIVTAFILAGGQSSRMGRDKALVPLNGQPLIHHAISLIHQLGLQPTIAGARSNLATYAPILPDDTPDRGPLSGICTALRHTTTELALFLPIDLPLLPASLLRYLIFHAQITGRAATLASLNAFPQTFPAVLRRNALPILESELQSNRTGCLSAFKTAGVQILPIEMLTQSGHISDPRALPPYRWFTNLNTPTDLRHADQCLQTREPGRPGGTRDNSPGRQPRVGDADEAAVP
ncbi:MAG TPA: molybdenum cofactor guanylyltransferase [Terracidiphilus sp.]